MVPGEYEEYAYQVLNSNVGKKRFAYGYIVHRPFKSGDIYWIMEHQLRDLKVDGRPCFEEAVFMPDETIMNELFRPVRCTGSSTVGDYWRSSVLHLPQAKKMLNRK